MKLYFEQRPFSWNDMYSIYDERDQRVYQVVAEEGKKANIITLTNQNDVEMGRVVCRRTIFGKWKFLIYIGDDKMGTVEKTSTYGVKRYELRYNRWIVCGNIPAFEYDIYDGKYMVMHAGNEDGAYPGKFVIDTSYSNNEQAVLLVALAMEAANSTLPPRK